MPIKGLEFENGMSPSTTGALTDDPAALTIQRELELYLHIGLSQMDQFIGTALTIARLPP